MADIEQRDWRLHFRNGSHHSLFAERLTIGRRELLAALGGAAASWPLAARAQQDGQVRHIGVLMAHTESDPEFQNYLSAFRQALRKLGWIEGRNIRIETRWGALDDADSRQQSAKELLALQPDVILTQNTPRVSLIVAALDRSRPAQTVP